MLKESWSKFVEDFREAKMLIVELEVERRGRYEPAHVWDSIVERMNGIEISDDKDKDKVAFLMTDVCRHLLLPTTTFPKTWLIKKLPELRDRLNYYKHNGDEEE